MLIKSTKAEYYLEAFAEIAALLAVDLRDFPLVQEFIATYEAEQRFGIEYLLQNGNPHGCPPEHVVYGAANPKEFERLCRTLVELFVERAEIMDFSNPNRPGADKEDSIECIGRMRARLRLLDIETQSLIYEFTQSEEHTPRKPTRPKSLKVLRKIHKAMRANWT